MVKLINNNKKIALVLLHVWIFNFIWPFYAYSLTSGPAQPETKGFQVAGVSDMVDLSSGELKYNIPLLDIDGYPINLSYQSGTGIDDEASWVGLGWSLNPGAINRQVRGVPDDFSGDNDQLVTEHTIKPKITVGGRATAKVEYGGIGKVNGSFTLGVFNDNYTGIGAEVGVNAGISFSLANDGMLTGGLGVGILSSTQSGVDVSPYVSLSVKENNSLSTSLNAGLTGTFGYNTRSGIKGLTLSQSFGASGSKDVKEAIKDSKGNHIQQDGQDIMQTVTKSGTGSVGFGGSAISYNTEPIQPSITTAYRTNYDSFSFDEGLVAFTVYGSLGGTGYRSIRSVKDKSVAKPAYGFLYSERGKDNPEAVMDFIREKDNPIIPNIPNLAIPIHTPDLWSFTNQLSSGQFRLFRRGTGVFFDSISNDESSVSSTGGDIGGGVIFHGGITHYDQHTTNVTRKWINDNNYLANGDFKNPNYNDPDAQGAYFKLVGEKTLEDQEINTGMSNSEPLKINIGQIQALSSFNNNSNLPNTLKLTSRRKATTVISYLTAGESSAKSGIALDYNINSYPQYDFSTSFVPPPLNKPIPNLSFGRTSDYRKSNHISELSVIDGGGKRMIYGIPVYNSVHDEYTFAVNSPKNSANNVAYNTNNNLITAPSDVGQNSFSQGLDNYYQKESKPAYSTSFLLTAILSPDYIDKTGDGISDDDLGTAIKFNYSKTSSNYKWRTPYSMATLNKCLQADPDDDKASIIYGEKELWYISSIESKTKIAYFITEDRQDGLGVLDWLHGGVDLKNSSNKQKCLRKIILYSKADLSRPIKTVCLNYDYSLCPGIPNSLNGGGKLTLSSVYFQYGNSTKGVNHPYLFSYNSTNSLGNVASYGNLLTDRWGVYKDPSENAPFNLDNEQFPYSDQTKTSANVNVALWHLSTITLPTGGKINVSYESGDYSYVQNKKAMVMTPISGLITTTTDANGKLITGPPDQLDGCKNLGITMNLGGNNPGIGVDQKSWFINNYLNGSKFLYTKFCIKVSTNASKNYGPEVDNDFVPCYGEISNVTVNNGVAMVTLKDLQVGDLTVNPISIAAWQRQKNEYPRYAYPGFDNRDASGKNSLLAAVSAVIDAVGNLDEITENFYEKAKNLHYASQVILNKSFVKIVKKDGIKLGGGARVKSIQIDDNWQKLSGNASATVATYGQSYDYRNTDNTSSGVASYEPSIGNDENPLKQPVPYIQNIKGAINNYFDLEQPFCESLYPAPGITYGRVKVTDLDSKYQSSIIPPLPPPVPSTGYTVNEFYTDKDFPVRVTVLPIVPVSKFNPQSGYSFLETDNVDELCMSQGYKIELNDMHGKPKSIRIYNKDNIEISSSVYTYQTVNTGLGEMALDNHVNVVNKDGSVDQNQIIGQDIDFFTDFREQETTNIGTTINLGADVIPFFSLPPFLVIPHFPVNINNDYKLFRSACALKVIQSYGIMSKVVKTINGSSNTSENLAYDPVTGDVLVSSTQNEFNQNIYSVKIPAYWAYSGMGPVYQNLGVILSGLTTSSTGQLLNDFSCLNPGDELENLDTGEHYWVVQEQIASSIILIDSAPGTTYGPGGTGNIKNYKFLMDRYGAPQSGLKPKLVKIIRSGYRNMLNEGITSIVCLNNPIVSNNNKYTLRLTDGGNLSDLKVINASASTYDESWSVEAPEYHVFEDNTPNFFVAYREPENANYDPNYQFPNSGIKGYLRSPFWAGRFMVSAVNVSTNLNESSIKSFGFTEQFMVDHDGFYNVGYESLNEVQIVFNCTDVIVNYNDSENHHPNNKYGWYIQKVHLFKGMNTFNIESNYGDGSLYGVGLEIYDNTIEEISSTDENGSNINIKFSTSPFFNNSGSKITQEYIIGNDNKSMYRYAFNDGLQTPLTPCTLPAAINPYIFGFKGNWRPYKSKVFQQSRVYSSGVKTANPGLSVNNAGYINKFYSNWITQGNSIWTENLVPEASNRWVTSNSINIYDKYGQQLENVDALNRYSSAKFGFNGELPSAVASNAMNREIYANSFEDTKFAPGIVTNSPYDPVREFVQNSTGNPISQFIDNTVSHSGNYSTLLPIDGISLSTIVYQKTQRSDNYLNLDNNYRFIKSKDATGQNIVGLYPNGFEPSSNKYLFDVWVRDNSLNDKSVNLGFSMNYNGSTVQIPLICKAVVDDWKLMEGNFDLSTTIVDNKTNPTLSYPLTLSINPYNANVHIDDIRIHPQNSQMKTYAYDDKSMRLMAELDENGFATFYEYDDEGLLIRVKKETEKGIVTLKESRSSYKK